MLFDADGKIRRYESPEEILTEFFDMRLMYYERRRVSLLQVGEGSTRDWTQNLKTDCAAAFYASVHTRSCKCTLYAPRFSTQQDAEWEHMRASNKIRFIKAVISGTLVINNKWVACDTMRPQFVLR